MEDAHIHLLSLPNDKDTCFFGVFDGHGGLYACDIHYITICNYIYIYLKCPVKKQDVALFSLIVHNFLYKDRS